LDSERQGKMFPQIGDSGRLHRSGIRTHLGEKLRRVEKKTQGKESRVDSFKSLMKNEGPSGRIPPNGAALRRIIKVDIFRGEISLAKAALTTILVQKNSREVIETQDQGIQ